jgi:hypothetical protein
MNRLRRALLAAPIAPLLRAQSIPDDFPQVGRVVAVGDVHGDKDAFAAVLKMAGTIDAEERWTGGKTHLVQIGDIPARGPQTLGGVEKGPKRAPGARSTRSSATTRSG